MASAVPLDLLLGLNCSLLSRLRKGPAKTAGAQTLTAVGNSCQAAAECHCPMCAELCGSIGAHLILLTFNTNKCTMYKRRDWSDALGEWWSKDLQKSIPPLKAMRTLTPPQKSQYELFQSSIN